LKEPIRIQSQRLIKGFSISTIFGSLHLNLNKVMKRNCFIGIDISKLKLDVCIYDHKHKKEHKYFIVENNEKGFKALIKKLLKEEIILKEVFVCLEHCGVYGLETAYFLDQKVSFCFCNPLHIKRSLGIVRGKNDKLDSFQIARFCYIFRDELKADTVPTELMLKIKTLMSERTRVKKAIVIEKQIKKDHFKYLSSSAQSRSIRKLKQLKEDKKCIEKEVEALINSDKPLMTNYELLTGIIGIGLVNATLMLLFTNNFKGITDARSFACYCGVAPFEHSSGTSVRGKTRVSRMANKKVKAELSNAARSAVIHDPELKMYYKRKRNEGKAHGTVLNAVKFKLITRSFAVVKRGTPFIKLRVAG